MMAGLILVISSGGVDAVFCVLLQVVDSGFFAPGLVAGCARRNRNGTQRQGRRFRTRHAIPAFMPGTPRRSQRYPGDRRVLPVAGRGGQNHRARCCLPCGSGRNRSVRSAHTLWPWLWTGASRTAATCWPIRCPRSPATSEASQIRCCLIRNNLRTFLFAINSP